MTSNLILLRLFSMCFQYNPNYLHNKNLLKSTSLEPMTDSKQQAMIRIPSKLTDELVTVDSPRRQSKIFSNSMYNTVQFRKTSSTNRHSILGKVQSVWFESASSIRRQKSPAFKFPQAQRFSSLESDQRKNRLILRLDIAGQLKGTKGASFAKSKRIDHFKPKKYVQDYPSPATYNSQMISQTYMTHQNPNGRNISTAGQRRSSMKFTQDFMNYKIKGVTIPKEKNPEKLFMHHAQKFVYQPDLSQGNPAVGNYFMNPEQKSSKKFILGQTLKKFNEFIAPNPGPGVYGLTGDMVPSKRAKSANSKGTFQLSKRTYLDGKKPDQFSPSPDSYKIKRFMER